MRRSRRKWSWLRGAYVCALAALPGLLLLTPVGGDLEEVYGLDALLRLRGATSAPPGVAIVAMDRASADNLGLPPPPRPWPRSVHARLVSILGERAAAAIVFDLLFAEERGEGDDGLAAAMQRTGNVVLLQGLQRRSIKAVPANPYAQDDVIDVAIDPVAPYRDAAIAVAPFPLPRNAARVTRFWTFRPGTDTPTLPSVALHLSARDITAEWATIAGLADETLGDPQLWQDRRLVASMTALRHRMKNDPGQAARLQQAITAFDTSKARRLSALLELYTGDDNRLLNFRGPAGTITTFSYSKLVDNGGASLAEIPALKDKTVLVGLADREVASQQDTYETAFSAKNAVNLSGVEILATGLSDLMNNATLKTSAPLNVLLVLTVALILGVAAATANTVVLAGVSFVLPFAVFGIGYWLLVAANLFVPVFTPAVVQIPAGALFSATALWIEERRGRLKLETRLKRAFPPETVRQLLGGPIPANSIPQGHVVPIVCLASDAQGFATVSERLQPGRLREIMTDYIASLREPVERRGGVVADLAGDGLICYWLAESDPAHARTEAIMAALDMRETVSAFNARHPGEMLPTRFGIHAGNASFGPVQGDAFLAPMLIGDVVNTTCRLQTLNKELNTSILASEQACSGVRGVATRSHGQYLLKGRKTPITVLEIVVPQLPT